MPFETVLVANRGEIAIRVIRTLLALGIRAVAVYTDPDALSRHIADADEAIRIPSYLDGAAIVEAAHRASATAIHPGYGFLAENARFAADCAAAGLVFVGPSPAAIAAMGDKIRAKLLVAAAGVAVVPGRTEPGMTDADLTAAAEEIGYPVLLKPSAGGGGKGMRLVHNPADLPAALGGARREARASFGDDTLLIERYVSNPRHIEVQVLGDTHGNLIHLGERECSLQRRHQKIIEEAPSPLLTPEARARLGDAAVAVAAAVGYTSAGTVEFIVSGDDPDTAYFLEMNTRLQVEHPVTELVTGLDLVELQLRIAAGEPLRLKQSEVTHTGHAVEARIYAEDPANGFLPTGGRIIQLREPAHIRVDSGLQNGTVVGGDYDPMLAKYIAHAPTRTAALHRLRTALADTRILGVTTNLGFLHDLLGDPEVIAGHLDTGLVERHLAAHPADPLPREVLVAAALERALDLEPNDPVTDPWDIPGGWRIGESAWATWRIDPGAVDIRIRGRAHDAEVAIAEGDPVPAAGHWDGGDPGRAAGRWDGGDLVITVDGRTLRYGAVRDGAELWLTRNGRTWRLTETGRLAARTGRATADGPVTSPMPGTVLAVNVTKGDTVSAGQNLVVVEAMKMEHTVTAPAPGTVDAVHVHPGDRVTLGQHLVTLEAQP